MAKRIRGKAVYPPPVYVAVFSDNTIVRMSYYSLAGKPLAQDAGRQMCCQALGNERASAIDCESEAYWESTEYRRLLRSHAQRLVNEAIDSIHGRKIGEIILFRERLPHVAAAADIVAGHTERKDTGQIVPDPFFGHNVVSLSANRRVKTNFEKAVALLGKLSESELAQLRERIVA